MPATTGPPPFYYIISERVRRLPPRPTRGRILLRSSLPCPRDFAVNSPKRRLRPSEAMTYDISNVRLRNYHVRRIMALLTLFHVH